MPIETVIVIAAIASPFIVFAVVLAWADFQTRSIYRKKPSSLATHSEV